MSAAASRHHLPALALLALSAAAPGLAAGTAPPTQRPVFLPGGTADPAGRTGFVTNPEGTIDAIDLARGRLLWQTRERARPLAVSGGRLAAWAPVPGKPNRLRVLAFDTAREGKRVLESDPVVFPDWVSVELTYGRTFSVTAVEVAGDNLLLGWQARAFYAGGAPPPPAVVEAARKQASGTARVNLTSGKVALLDPGEGPAAAGPRPPPELRGVTSRQYWTGSDWQTRPLAAGGVVAALDQQALPGGRQRLTLKRWDRKSGKALGPVVLLEGKELWPQVRPGGGYVFVHQALVKEALPPGDYAWWVFSLETGRQVGKLPFEPGTEAMTVIGPRAFLLVPGRAKGRPPGLGAFTAQPRVLKAYDLASGRLLWERPVEPLRRLPPLP